MGTTENTEGTEMNEMRRAGMRNVDRITSTLFFSVASVFSVVQ
jgi:hypothetical protein